MKRAILLYNEKAGRGKIAGKIENIVRMFSDVDCVLLPRLISFDKNPFDGEEASDLVVIAGGDGTVNYVVNAMKRKGLDIPLAIIPTGTANDFAGSIGMSADVMKAAHQIIEGEVDEIDCGLVEQINQEGGSKKYFINIFSFGIFTTTSQHTPQHLKKRVGRFAYFMEGLKELRTMHGIPLTITTDNETFYYPTLMGLVLNGETAGRLPLMRKASLKDGVFDCLFLRKRHLLGLSAIDMLLYVFGVRTNAVRYIKSSSLMLMTPSSEATDIDGQSGVKFPLQVTCLSGALRVVCPKSS
ncbi:MAG: YegS/Rv2252/BmrU family lipid kinase [Alistipes sp.]|nr:YegS/Rv2252/BmrU family lipid kinase [Alistipes sp.]MBQ6988586.1 YegS/Rv2252/BmrU family lipid kinase [Alistipes sp.]